MKTITMYTDCLTFEQLQSYTSVNTDKAEYAQLYKHISSCELCTCAVNGFAAIPFTSADVDAIHNQIDVRTNATHANLLTFAQVFIVLISLLSIFGFYEFANSLANKKNKTEVAANSLPHVNLPKASESFHISSENKIITEDKTGKLVRIYTRGVLEKAKPSVELAESIPVKIIIPALSFGNDALQPTFNSVDITYMYDLKVADYKNLYFTHADKQLDFNKNTPANRENKKTADNLTEIDSKEVIAAYNVLKKGLEYFKNNKYDEAISEFTLLLENNPNDVNALFYSGLCFYQDGKYSSSIKSLETILLNTNNVFHPEAKWNLALAYLKSGNKTRAKQLLSEIAEEKGFYANRASEKLKTL